MTLSLDQRGTTDMDQVNFFFSSVLWPVTSSPKVLYFQTLSKHSSPIDLISPNSFRRSLLELTSTSFLLQVDYVPNTFFFSLFLVSSEHISPPPLPAVAPQCSFQGLPPLTVLLPLGKSHFTNPLSLKSLRHSSSLSPALSFLVG